MTAHATPPRTRCAPRCAPRWAALAGRATSATLVLLLTATLVAGQAAEQAPGTGPEQGRGSALHQPAADTLHLVAASTADRLQKALRAARRQKGDAYEYGAEGPDTFDCSGLVYFATHRAGFDDVPRTSADQAEHMRRIKKKNLRRGDFVFFTGSSGVYHVGFYVGRRDGDRSVLHAPKPGTAVRVEDVWGDSWFAATLR